MYIRLFCLWIGTLFAFSKAYGQKAAYLVPEIGGPFIHIFDPGDERKEGDSAWYTNDHTFIRGRDGSWHAYGIIHHLPVRP